MANCEDLGSGFGRWIDGMLLIVMRLGKSLRRKTFGSESMTGFRRENEVRRTMKKEGSVMVICSGEHFIYSFTAMAD